LGIKVVTASSFAVAGSQSIPDHLVAQLPCWYDSQKVSHWIESRLAFQKLLDEKENDMATKTRSLLDQALALPAKKREALAEKLWRSLDDGTQEEIQQAWLDEIGRRVEDLRSGKVKAIPGKKVMASIRKDILK
jgi:putative addiction module component (TIGR02574 family)